MATGSAPFFVSLSQARAVRDRLAAYAVEDVARFTPQDNAEKIIERLCCAQGDYRTKIKELKARAFDTWDGEGLPDWSYMDQMGDAIEWIAREEYRLVKLSLQNNQVTDAKRSV